MVLSFRIHPDLKPVNQDFTPYLKNALNQLANHNPVIQKYQCGLIQYQLFAKFKTPQPLITYAVQIKPQLKQSCLKALKNPNIIFNTITEFCQAVLKSYLMESKIQPQLPSNSSHNFKNSYSEIYYYIDMHHTYHLFIPGTDCINRLIFQPPSIQWLLTQCRYYILVNLKYEYINFDIDYFFKNHTIFQHQIKCPRL